MTNSTHPLEQAVVDAEDAKEGALSDLRSIHRRWSSLSSEDQDDDDADLEAAYRNLAGCSARAFEAQEAWAAFLMVTAK